MFIKIFERDKLKRLLADFKGQVTFTLDMCLIAHYVDDSFKLNNKILTFCELKPPHNVKNSY